MSREVVIQVDRIAKEYRLGTINHGMLYRDLQSWWARLRGHSDPNAKLVERPIEAGDEDRLIGDRFLALDDISFELKRGEILGVVGRNGAGKSTLLKILSRITLPTRGEIRIRGRVASLLEVGTGFHAELTGRENVFLNGAILGMTRREVVRKLDEIVEFAEIGRFLDTPVKRYSSGMYVRLAFGVAAHLDPEILIVDEVLAVGDLSFQRKCLGKMDLVSKQGRTVIFVSHNLTAVNQLCGRCLLLSGGRLTAEGETTSVIAKYVQLNELARRASKEYPPDITNEPVRIRRVSVTDMHGNEYPRVAMNSEFDVWVDYQIYEKVAGVTVGLQLIAEEGNQTVISLSDPELDLERLNPRPLGYYRSKVRIPANLLNSGPYRVRVGVSTRFKVFQVSEDVFFDVHDTIGIVQALGWERKNSVLALQVPWQATLIQ